MLIAFLLWCAIVSACVWCADSPAVVKKHEVRVEHSFPLIITDMTSSSKIAIPSGANFDCRVINSADELHRLLLPEIIEDTPGYDDIDFTEQSLVSLKFRSFYKIKYINSKVYRGDYNLEVRQTIHVSPDYTPSGFYVMANLLTDTVPDNLPIRMVQTYRCD